MVTYVLRLYIAGQTSQSQRAIDNLHSICEQMLGAEHDVTVIDVLENPSAAEADKILATPTLVRLSPGPIRKIIGDLSDLDKVLTCLEIGRFNGGMDC
jgi:circadian clock protein KaiB